MADAGAVRQPTRNALHAAGTLAPPIAIAGWECLGLAGRGRIANVYRARPAASRPTAPRQAAAAGYALKVLHPSLEQSADAVESLRREAWVSRAAADPHLSTVLSAHVERPPYFLVLPYLEGADLATRGAGGWRPALPVALWIARQAALALVALHAAGWVHGDVKPANLVLSSTGHVTLIDLGFAIPYRSAGAGDSTSSRRAAGTPPYLAPEALAGASPPDPRSDLYSLGMVLHELVSVERAGHAKRPDYRGMESVIPAGVTHLLRQLTANDSLRRPDSAADVVARLARWEVLTLEERPWQQIEGLA